MPIVLGCVIVTKCLYTGVGHERRPAGHCRTPCTGRVLYRQRDVGYP